MSEAEWQNMVVAKAAANGWEHYHTLDSRGSDEGFPDLVLAKVWPNNYWARLIHVELKTDDGVQTEAQQKWERLIKKCGGTYLLWRPSMWADVQKTLSEPME